MRDDVGDDYVYGGEGGSAAVDFGREEECREQFALAGRGARRGTFPSWLDNCR